MRMCVEWRNVSIRQYLGMIKRTMNVRLNKQKEKVYVYGERRKYDDKGNIIV